MNIIEMLLTLTGVIIFILGIVFIFLKIEEPGRINRELEKIEKLNRQKMSVKTKEVVKIEKLKAELSNNFKEVKKIRESIQTIILGEMTSEVFELLSENEDKTQIEMKKAIKDVYHGRKSINQVRNDLRLVSLAKSDTKTIYYLDGKAFEIESELKLESEIERR
jgi:hypothetical protein